MGSKLVSLSRADGSKPCFLCCSCRCCCEAIIVEILVGDSTYIVSHAPKLEFRNRNVVGQLRIVWSTPQRMRKEHLPYLSTRLYMSLCSLSCEALWPAGSVEFGFLAERCTCLDRVQIITVTRTSRVSVQPAAIPAADHKAYGASIPGCRGEHVAEQYNAKSNRRPPRDVVPSQPHRQATWLPLRSQQPHLHLAHLIELLYPGHLLRPRNSPPLRAQRMQHPR